ncbi:MAG: hypothetical protein MZV64_14105 [Ignavibacteriales bacterium]|nr:hypothetical protein [Ignavibacteriales bacterium]
MLRLSYQNPNDGSQNWSIKMQIIHIGLSYIYAIDENNVYAVGANKIFKTTDGGTNWIDVSPNLPDRNYNSLWFQDTQTGLVVGSYNDGTADRGITLKTTDGGSTWGETIVNEFNDITDLQFLDSANGYFKANLDTTNFLCKTEDICSSWVVITQGSNSFTSFQFLNKSIVYAILSDSINFK